MCFPLSCLSVTLVFKYPNSFICFYCGQSHAAYDQLIIGYVALSTYYLEYGRHVARLRRRRRAYAPMSKTASHDNHEKINSWVFFSFLYEYGAPLELRYYDMVEKCMIFVGFELPDISLLA